MLLWLLGFVTLASYAIVRPGIESLFLARHGSRGLPLVWVAVAFATALVVVALNRGFDWMSLHRLFLVTLTVSAGGLCLLISMQGRGLKHAEWLLYVWKDVYIISLVELLWTTANILFSIRAAKRAYGWFCLSGSLGGLFGNRVMEYGVKMVGTLNVLYLSLPAFILAALFSTLLHSRLGLESVTVQPRKKSHGFPLLSKLTEKRYVAFLVALVAIVQVVITLTDFQFQYRLERVIPDIDERTKIIGRVYGGVDALSMCLQLSTSLILGMLGVPITLVAIPVVVGTALIAFVVNPSVSALIVAKISSKGFDYSIFRSAKEILYIPLSVSDKTVGKALVDIFTYRAAKALASLVLFILVQFSLELQVGVLIVSLVVGWFVISLAIVRRFSRLTHSPQQSPHSQPA